MEKKTIKKKTEQKPVIKEPLSKVITNIGIKPIIIKQTRVEKIVLHPRKEMRLETKEANTFIDKYKTVKEK